MLGDGVCSGGANLIVVLGRSSRCWEVLTTGSPSAAAEPPAGLAASGIAAAGLAAIGPAAVGPGAARLTAAGPAADGLAAAAALNRTGMGA